MRHLVAALMLATLAACGSSGTADAPTDPGAASIAGVYRLKTINGQTLPVTFQLGPSIIELSEDVITINNDASWSESMTYRRTLEGQTTDVSETDNGNWVRDGDLVRLQSGVPGGGFFFATYANGSLTFSDPGFVQVFTR